MSREVKSAHTIGLLLSAIERGDVVRAEEYTRRLSTEMRTNECPKCNTRNVAMTPKPISYGHGEHVRVTHVCMPCLSEIRAGVRGSVAMYTKG